MEASGIELLAAKYLEIGGIGQLDDKGHFVRDLAHEHSDAIALWDEHVQPLNPEDQRRFEFLVSELRIATN